MKTNPSLTRVQLINEADDRVQAAEQFHVVILGVTGKQRVNRVVVEDGSNCL